MHTGFFYAVVYKPYQVLTQFSEVPGKLCLRDFFRVPVDVYPVGRLDYDSEGLLLLTNDKRMNAQLLQPGNAHERTYWVQVDGAVTESALQQLEKGVLISVDGKKIKTRPAKAKLLTNTPRVPDRNPPIRFRAAIPTSWIALTLTEGKNRQVRKMTAAVGFPTLRLIRYQIGNCMLDALMPGDMRMIAPHEISSLFPFKP